MTEDDDIEEGLELSTACKRKTMSILLQGEREMFHLSPSSENLPIIH